MGIKRIIHSQQIPYTNPKSIHDSRLKFIEIWLHLKLGNCIYLSMIDRVPDELWTEVCDIVQEAGIKTIPEKKKCKKAKWLFEEGLQTTMKKREAKGK